MLHFDINMALFCATQTLIGYFGNIDDIKLCEYRDGVIGLCQQGSDTAQL